MTESAIILAGGMGTRLRPITDTTPKCLVSILDRPLLDYWFEALATTDARDVRINTHHLPEPVRDFIDAKNRDNRFAVAESYEPELLGSAGTITANRDLADGVERVFVIYADNLSAVDLADMSRFHRAHGDPATMLLFHAENPSVCGIVELDADDRVTTFVEKPDDPRSDLANAGVYIFSADTYREVADMGAFDLGHDVLPKLVGRTRGYVLDGYHRDIGTLAALEAAQVDAARVFGLGNRADV